MLQQHYKKLNQEERFYISKRIQAGDNQRQIAMDLKRSPSTILREIARNQNSTTSLYSNGTKLSCIFIESPCVL